MPSSFGAAETIATATNTIKNACNVRSREKKTIINQSIKYSLFRFFKIKFQFKQNCSRTKWPISIMFDTTIQQRKTKIFNVEIEIEIEISVNCSCNLNQSHRITDVGRGIFLKYSFRKSICKEWLCQKRNTKINKSNRDDYDSLNSFRFLVDVAHCNTFLSVNSPSFFALSS